MERARRFTLLFHLITRPSPHTPSSPISPITLSPPRIHSLPRRPHGQQSLHGCVSLINTSRSFPPPAPETSSTHNPLQNTTKHDNSQSRNPSATLPVIPISLSSNTIQLGQIDGRKKRSTDRTKTKDWPCEQVKVLLACASCVSTGPQSTSVEEHLTATCFFTRGSFT
jgi:hypothetical protein